MHVLRQTSPQLHHCCLGSTVSLCCCCWADQPELMHACSLIWTFLVGIIQARRTFLGARLKSQARWSQRAWLLRGN